MSQSLQIVMYHYVRDLPRTRYPQIKGMLASDFRDQVKALAAGYEMATLESAIAFLRGEYHPSRDLCLLTFDDGLKEHWTECTPVLADLGIQGVFSLITGCIEEQVVAPVHMNHFLMASLPFDAYRVEFLTEISKDHHTAVAEEAAVDASRATSTYIWDDAGIAKFKYFFNFLAPAKARDAATARMFARHIGPQDQFAKELYVSWEEARRMQDAGMALSGHSHRHQPLATLTGEPLAADLSACKTLLDQNVKGQSLWPFCYPYGKSDSYNEEVIGLLKDLRFDCAFTTKSGPALAGSDLFHIARVDCKNAKLAAAVEEVSA
jgi:peptidoglycan/xylan/chitin deacetylase (PgdA/CDA1 family)